MRRVSMQMTDNTVSDRWWKALVEHFVREGAALELRCWQEETEEIRAASRYGTPVCENCEVVVKGTVTQALLQELQAEQPTDKSLYNKMTKYFALCVTAEGCLFSGEHYGTELYIEGLSDGDLAWFRRTIAPYQAAFSMEIA